MDSSHSSRETAVNRRVRNSKTLREPQHRGPCPWSLLTVLWITVRLAKTDFSSLTPLKMHTALTLLLPPLYWLTSVKQCDSDDFKFVSPQWNQNLKKNSLKKKKEKKEFCTILLIIYTVHDNLSDLCGKASEDIQCRLGRLKVTYFMTGWS